MPFDPEEYRLPIPEENYYDEEAAQKVIDFIENLRHYEGKWAGEKVELMDWQKDKILRPLFGLKKPDGTRQYKTAYIEIPRKNGKSLIASGIALYLLCADGEGGPKIYGAAYDRAQASIVFETAQKMVEQSEELSEAIEITPYKKLMEYPGNDGKYQAISKETRNKHGGNAHGIIFDELHTQRNREMWDVLDTSTGARQQPLMFAITTAGNDRNSICWEQHQYAKDLLAGHYEDPSHFAAIWSAEDYVEREEENSWSDEEAWIEANPALYDPDTDEGFRSLEDLRDKATKAEKQKGYRNTFKRLFLNIWTSAESQAIDPDDWSNLQRNYEESELEGEECYSGLDLASKQDLAAAAHLFPYQGPENDEIWIVPRIFCPEEKVLERTYEDGVDYKTWADQGWLYPTPGNVIDYEYIQKTLENDAKTFDIQSMGYDDWEADHISQQLHKQGIEMVPTRMGYKSLSAPTKELLRLVASGKICNNGNGCLSWTASNLVTQEDPSGNLKPSKSKSNEKIDPMVAVILGIDRILREFYDEDNTGESKYEEEGLSTLGD